MLAKVFNTSLSIYIIAVVFSHWMQDLSDYCQEYYWEQKNYDEKLKSV